MVDTSGVEPASPASKASFRPPGVSREMVGATGFEPAACRSRTGRSTGLSYTPRNGRDTRSRTGQYEGCKLVPYRPALSRRWKGHPDSNRDPRGQNPMHLPLCYAPSREVVRAAGVEPAHAGVSDPYRDRLVPRAKWRGRGESNPHRRVNGPMLLPLSYNPVMVLVRGVEPRFSA